MLPCELLPCSLQSYIGAIGVIYLGEVLPVTAAPQCSHSSLSGPEPALSEELKLKPPVCSQLYCSLIL